MSLPEVLLWQELRQRPGGLKFRRQHAVGPYVLDFFCASDRLAIEIDGRSHDCNDQPQRDIARDEWLAGQDIRCVRIAAPRVLDDAASIGAWVVSIADATLVVPPLYHRKSDGPPPRAGEDHVGPGLSA